MPEIWKPIKKYEKLDIKIKVQNPFLKKTHLKTPLLEVHVAAVNLKKKQDELGVKSYNEHAFYVVKQSDYPALL